MCVRMFVCMYLSTSRVIQFTGFDRSMMKCERITETAKHFPQASYIKPIDSATPNHKIQE